jgi:hypothetical protein
MFYLPIRGRLLEMDYSKPIRLTMKRIPVNPLSLEWRIAIINLYLLSRILPRLLRWMAFEDCLRRNPH